VGLFFLTITKGYLFAFPGINPKSIQFFYVRPYVKFLFRHLSYITLKTEPMHIVRQLLLPQLAVLLLFAACNNRAAQPQADKLAALDRNVDLQKIETAKQEEAVNTTDTSASVSDNLQLPAPPAANAPPKQDWDKKIIKTATLTLEVKNYQAFNDLLHTGVRETGGYISQEEQNQSDYKIENIITIKVPVDQFDNALARLIPTKEKLVEKKITSEDVTTEVVDTKSRIQSKKMVRERYLELLKQAKNMKEILAVQSEINGIQEEEESAAGRMQYLSHASSWSTIHLTYYQVLNASAGETTPSPSFGTKVLDSFVTGLKWLGELLVTLVAIWPLWVGIITAWFLIKRYRALLTKKSQ
jgi:hypothetical protein